LNGLRRCGGLLVNHDHGGAHPEEKEKNEGLDDAFAFHGDRC
jgi:hypothetical protein